MAVALSFGKELVDILWPILKENVRHGAKSIFAGAGVGFAVGCASAAINAFVGTLGFTTLTGAAAQAFLAGLGVTCSCALAPTALIVGGFVLVGAVIGGVYTLFKSTGNLLSAIEAFIKKGKDQAKTPEEKKEFNKNTDDLIALLERSKFPDV